MISSLLRAYNFTPATLKIPFTWSTDQQAVFFRRMNDNIFVFAKSQTSLNYIILKTTDLCTFTLVKTELIDSSNDLLLSWLPQNVAAPKTIVWRYEPSALYHPQATSDFKTYVKWSQTFSTIDHFTYDGTRYIFKFPSSTTGGGGANAYFITTDMVNLYKSSNSITKIDLYGLLYKNGIYYLFTSEGGFFVTYKYSTWADLISNINYTVITSNYTGTFETFNKQVESFQNGFIAYNTNEDLFYSPDLINWTKVDHSKDDTSFVYKYTRVINEIHENYIFQKVIYFDANWIYIKSKFYIINSNLVVKDSETIPELKEGIVTDSVQVIYKNKRLLYHQCNYINSYFWSMELDLDKYFV